MRDGHLRRHRRPGPQEADAGDLRPRQPRAAAAGLLARRVRPPRLGRPGLRPDRARLGPGARPHRVPRGGLAPARRGVPLRPRRLRRRPGLRARSGRRSPTSTGCAAPAATTPSTSRSRRATSATSSASSRSTAWPTDTPDTWRRVVVEKPFGSDLETAQELNDVLSGVFPPESVFRIDHYLGKETVQNILAMRFANMMFEPIWNANYVDHVQITMAEDIGIGGRAGYYDGIGAARDVIQNHLIQLMALHRDGGADLVRRRAACALEKLKVLESVVLPRRLDLTTARGQYAAGLGRRRQGRRATSTSPTSPRPRRPRPTPPSGSASTTAAGRACRSTCAPASGSAVGSPRWRSVQAGAPPALPRRRDRGPQPQRPGHPGPARRGHHAALRLEGARHPHGDPRREHGLRVRRQLHRGLPRGLRAADPRRAARRAAAVPPARGGRAVLADPRPDRRATGPSTGSRSRTPAAAGARSPPTTCWPVTAGPGGDHDRSSSSRTPTPARIAAALVEARRDAGSPAMGMVMTLVVVADEDDAERGPRRRPRRRAGAPVPPARRRHRLGARHVPHHRRDPRRRRHRPASRRSSGSRARSPSTPSPSCCRCCCPTPPSSSGGPATRPADPAERPGRPAGHPADHRRRPGAAAARAQAMLASAAPTRRATPTWPGPGSPRGGPCSPPRSTRSDGKVTGVEVAAERVSPSADLLAAWLSRPAEGARHATQLRRSGHHRGGAHHEVRRHPDRRATTAGTPRSACPASPTVPSPCGAATSRTLLTEELRRLDPDDVYAATVRRRAEHRIARPPTRSAPRHGRRADQGPKKTAAVESGPTHVTTEPTGSSARDRRRGRGRRWRRAASRCSRRSSGWARAVVVLTGGTDRRQGARALADLAAERARRRLVPGRVLVGRRALRADRRRPTATPARRWEDVLRQLAASTRTGCTRCRPRTTARRRRGGGGGVRRRPRRASRAACRRSPWFDVLMLGIGPDGHCASLFPGRPEVDDGRPSRCAVTDSPKPPPDADHA